MPDTPSPTPRPSRFGHRLRALRDSLRRRAGSPGAAALMRRPGRLVPPVLGSLVAVAVAGTAMQGLGELRETRQRQRELTAEVETLRAGNAGLEETIARLREDPEALRLHAKSTLDLVEPGEAVVLLRFPERFGPVRAEPADPRSLRDPDTPPVEFPDGRR